MGSNQTPEGREATAQRRAQVVAWRREGIEYAEIGRLLNPDEPLSKQRVHQIYTEALQAIPASEVKLMRAEQNERLEEIYRRTMEIATKDHVVVSHGIVVREGKPYVDDDGEARIAEGKGAPLLDDGPKLHAMRVGLSALSQQSKLFGLDAPVKVEHGGETTVNYVVEGVDVSKLT